MADQILIKEFIEFWKPCVTSKIHGDLTKLANGSPLIEAIDEIINELEGNEVAQQIAQGLDALGSPILKVIASEIQFLCHLPHADTNEDLDAIKSSALKAKILLKSLLALLPTLDIKIRNLLHLLIEMIDLLQ